MRAAAVIPAFIEEHDRVGVGGIRSLSIGRRDRRRSRDGTTSGRGARARMDRARRESRWRYAVRTGWRARSIVLTHVLMDGDMQHLPEEAAPLRRGQRSAPISSSASAGSSATARLLRYYANRTAAASCRFVGILLMILSALPRVPRRCPAAAARRERHETKRVSAKAGGAADASRQNRSPLFTPAKRASCGRYPTPREPVFWPCTIASSNVSERSVTDSPPTWIR